MPDYEFACDECHKVFTQTIAYKDYGRRHIYCPFCGSGKISRRIGRVRIARSESAHIQEMSDWVEPQRMDELEKNPRELGKVMRRMSKEIGGDVGPEFNEVVDRLERGQTPAEIEKNLPEVDAPEQN